MNLDFNMLGGESAKAIALFALVVAILSLLVDIAFVVGVYRNALNIEERVVITWPLATLLGGVFVAAAYWVVHHSRLNREIPLAAPHTAPTEGERPKA